MIRYHKDDIALLDFLPRLSLVNSITGYKPANLIGTNNSKGQTNLAIISSVVHFGSNPPIIGFVMRPHVGERHTLENILETGYFTINHVHKGMVKNAHFTSADFERDVSEFDACHLTSLYLEGFKAPYVQESNIKIGMSLAEKIDIKLNGTILILGNVEDIWLSNAYFSETYGLDLNSADSVCISGLDTYHKPELITKFPYAKPDTLPNFIDVGR